MTEPKDVLDAEARGRVQGQRDAKVAALEEHARRVNGSLDRIDTRLGGIERSLASVLSEKKSIVSLQNRQVAFMAALGTVIYLLVEHVH